MSRALICTGVLGGGTAVVFALALAVAVLFPQGSMVPAGWSGGWAKPMPMPGMQGGGWIGDDIRVEEVAPAPVPADPVVVLPEPVEKES